MTTWVGCFSAVPEMLHPSTRHLSARLTLTARSAFDRSDQRLDQPLLREVDRFAVGGEHTPLVRASDFLVFQFHAQQGHQAFVDDTQLFIIKAAAQIEKLHLLLFFGREIDPAQFVCRLGAGWRRAGGKDRDPLALEQCEMLFDELDAVDTASLKPTAIDNGVIRSELIRLERVKRKKVRIESFGDPFGVFFDKTGF